MGVICYNYNFYYWKTVGLIACRRREWNQKAEEGPGTDLLAIQSPICCSYELGFVRLGSTMRSEKTDQPFITTAFLSLVVVLQCFSFPLRPAGTKPGHPPSATQRWMRCP